MLYTCIIKYNPIFVEKNKINKTLLGLNCATYPYTALRFSTSTLLTLADRANYTMLTAFLESNGQQFKLFGLLLKRKHVLYLWFYGQDVNTASLSY